MTATVPDRASFAAANADIATLLLRRLAARAIDAFTVLFLTFALTVTVLVGTMAWLSEFLAFGPWGRALAPTLLYLFVAVVYETIFISRRGQTPGKDVMCVAVVDAEGETPDVWTSLWRSVLVLSPRLAPGLGLGTLLVAVLGVSSPLDGSGRGLHDLAAHTSVVRRDPDVAEARRWGDLEDEIEQRYGPRSWWRALMKDRLR